MVGYAFMGAAHSQAWRPRRASSTCRSTPRMPALCGRDAGRGREAAAPAGLGVDGDRLARLIDARRHRPGRHLHARRHATPRSRSPRSRPASTCCARSRWPTRSPRPQAMAAAADRGGRARRAGDGRLQLPPRARGRAGPPAGRRGPDRRRSGTCARSTCRTGSSTRTFPLSWRLREGQGRLRRAGRHRRAHRRPHPVHHRRPDHRRQRADRDVRARATAGRRRLGTLLGGGRARTAGPPVAVTVDDAALFLARFAGGALGVVRGDPVRHRPQERDPPRDQRLARQPGLRLRGHERAGVLRRPGAAETAGLPPDPGHRADPPVRRRLVAARARARLRAHASPTRSSTWSTAIARGEQPTPSFADGLQVQRCSRPSSAAPRPAPGRSTAVPVPA